MRTLTKQGVRLTRTEDGRWSADEIIPSWTFKRADDRWVPKCSSGLHEAVPERRLHSLDLAVDWVLAHVRDCCGGCDANSGPISDMVYRREA